MGYIFISYSRKDKEYVHKLQEALQKESFNVWIDDRIDYGDEWLKVIEKHLDECDAFIIVMSKNSYVSDMVQNEITRAREKKKPIFPLLLEGENWFVVQAKQYVNVTDGSLPPEKFYKRLERVVPRIKNEPSSVLSKDAKSTYQNSWDISEEKYRERVKELHSKIRILNRESVQIDSFYVELSITSGLSSKQHHSAKDLEKDFRDARRLSRKEREAHLKDLILEKDKIFLSGKPGSGKTVSLKYIAVLAAVKKIEKMPVFISLTDLVNSSQELMQYIIEQFELCGFPNPDIFIETSLKKGNLLFLFDGFDEVLEETGQRIQVQNDIIKFVDRYPDNKFIISCRSAASNYQFANFTYFEINDFDDGQADSYIRNWFINDQDMANQFIEQLQQPQHWNVKEITQNPLLLNLLCIVFEETKRIPSKKSDLYREAMDCLLQKWDESKGIKRDQVYRVLSLKNKKKLLAFLAFNFSNRGTMFFDQDKAATFIVDFLTKLRPKNNKGEIDGNVVLSAIEAQHGLIIKRAEYIFSFSHLSFQEYFASRHVVETNTKSVLKEFFSHINDGSWEEIFLLTSGMQEDPDSFFNKFIKVVTSLVSKDKKLKNVLKWCDEKREDSYVDIHPALGRMITAKLFLILIILSTN